MFISRRTFTLNKRMALSIDSFPFHLQILRKITFFFIDLTLLVEDIYRVLYYNKVKMEDDFVAVLTSMLAVETIGRKLIGNDQNLFHAIEKHFAMQFKKEQI